MKAFHFTQSELHSILDYDLTTGIFRWRVCPTGTGGGVVSSGSVAGSDRGDGYRRIRINKAYYFAHRLAWFYIHGESPKYIDHRDGVRSNNAISNLRPASASQNIANKRHSKNNTSGFKGVSLDKRRGTYAAYLTVNRKRRCLGAFPTAEEAHAAYMAAATDHFGEFARAA